MNGKNRVFTRLLEANNCGDLCVFDGLYELQRRVLVDHKAVHAASIAQLCLKGCLVGFAQPENLCILEICVQKVNLERIIGLQVMCHHAYQVEALGAIVSLVIQDQKFFLRCRRLRIDVFDDPESVPLGFG